MFRIKPLFRPPLKTLSWLTVLIVLAKFYPKVLGKTFISAGGLTMCWIDFVWYLKCVWHLAEMKLRILDRDQYGGVVEFIIIAVKHGYPYPMHVDDWIDTGKLYNTVPLMTLDECLLGILVGFQEKDFFMAYNMYINATIYFEVYSIYDKVAKEINQMPNHERWGYD